MIARTRVGSSEVSVGREEDVAALDGGGDVGVAELLKEIAEVSHREFVVAADVDAAEQDDVGGRHR